MATRDTIVIGASAGGVQALYKLVSALPPDLPAADFIVLHIPSNVPSFLPDILARESRLTVTHAEDGEKIEYGRVYVAPPDRHLLIEDSHIKLVHGPKENLHRPAIDALFRSAARWAGPRVIGTILTGARADGTVGMRAIKQRGGCHRAGSTRSTLPKHALKRASGCRRGLLTAPGRNSATLGPPVSRDR